VPRFLDFEDLDLQEARAYAKKPRQGKAGYPLVNQNPPTSTVKDSGPPHQEPPAKRNRPHMDEDDTSSVDGSQNRDHSASTQGKQS